MTTPSNHSDHPDQHINAVLEPVAPGSQYDFIEIESNPIKFESPFARLPKFISRTFKMGKDCAQLHWKIALVVLVVLIGSELALRAYEPRLMGRIYSQTHTGGHPININAQGFRGDPVALIKLANTTRILALGDSVTFGTGVAADTTWTTQLQQLLSTDEHPVEVINAALPAIDLGHIEQELINTWKAYQPDQIVLVLTGNMVSFGYARKDRTTIELPNSAKLKQIIKTPAPSLKDKLKAQYASFALPGALTLGMDHLKFMVGLEDHASDPAFPTGVMLAHGYTQNGIDSAMIDQAWQIFAAQLASLVSVTNEMGVELTVVYSPPRFMLTDSRLDNLKWVDKDRLAVDPVAKSAQICQELGVPFIDPRSSLTQADKPVYLISDYTHFDASGHHTIAQLIADSITKP